MDWVHPEDQGRRFVMMYSLADDTIRMTEIRRKNSGIMEGKFLRAMRVQTPDSDPNFPTYYNPNMFYIAHPLLDKNLPLAFL
ncbi:EF-hand domain-containing protein 1 [Eumeta japonica]|uniref:EF-hand domain-containing protein 1 n=1 Tax=Eumeta variegata TaxID=151549 RepID=A0A4C1YTR8_EUMVA|nr:EF-hand domain-containing protein 1 [Eumeta japonica]